MKNVAIIPARAGSKRIKGKNIKLFHKQPMISWVIQLAIKSGFFDKTIVSTDCHKIANLSRSLGAEVPFIRPNSLSDDHTSVIDVVRHALNFFKSMGESYDWATLIYPTAPLLTKSDLQKAINAPPEYDFSVSVARYSYPIQRALYVDSEANTVNMLNKDNFMKRSQDLPIYFHDAGQFIVGKANSWHKYDPFIEGKSFPVQIERARVQDIDDDEDWEEEQGEDGLPQVDVVR